MAIATLALATDWVQCEAVARECISEIQEQVEELTRAFEAQKHEESEPPTAKPAAPTADPACSDRLQRQEPGPSQGPGLVRLGAIGAEAERQPINEEDVPKGTRDEPVGFGRLPGQSAEPSQVRPTLGLLEGA